MKFPVSLAQLLRAAAALAQGPLARLELGAGLFALSAPDYRGSSESSSYLLPALYIKYRGDRLRVDEGAQGVIFESDDLLLTLSGNLSPPAYDGDGGFSGYRSEFTYSRRIGQYWLGGFVHWPGYSTKTSHHA